QGDSCVRSFNEVMTEEPLLREASFKYFVESAYVIDGLSVIDCFAEKVLIDVGNGLAVRIVPARIREQPSETRCRRRRKSDTDTRLDDCVPTDAVAFILSELNPVQRMRHRFNQSPCTAVG